MNYFNKFIKNYHSIKRCIKVNQITEDKVHTYIRGTSLTLTAGFVIITIKDYFEDYFKNKSKINITLNNKNN